MEWVAQYVEGSVTSQLKQPLLSDGNRVTRAVIRLQTGLGRVWTRHRFIWWRVIVGACIFVQLLYFLYAISRGPRGMAASIFFGGVIVMLFKPKEGVGLGQRVSAFLQPMRSILRSCHKTAAETRLAKWAAKSALRRCGSAIPLLVVLSCILGDILSKGNYYNLTSLAGLVLLIALCLLTSKKPSKITLRPVAGGLTLQLLLGVLILRWRPGYDFFHAVSDYVERFLDYSEFGASFVFDDGHGSWVLHRIAFKVTATVFFFGAAIMVMYHLGVMQAIIRVLAATMGLFLGTSPVESLSAAANIFLGGTEVALLMKPFLATLTLSEIHLIVTAGFASVSGSAFAIFLELGVPSEHLLAAVLLSAPASLVVAKLLYPETEEDVKQKTSSHLELSMSQASPNVVDAAMSGARMAGALIAYVVTNIIAFVSIVFFLDAAVQWTFERVGIQKVTFQGLGAYAFWPLTFMLGVEAKDCFLVSATISTRVLVNPLISYRQIAILKQQAMISDRSAAIGTYALCCFASLCSIGISLSAYAGLEPARKKDFTSVTLRAFVAGNIASFMTACVAGLLYNPVPSVVPSPSSWFNVTTPTL